MRIQLSEENRPDRRIMGFMMTAAEKCVSDAGLDPSLTEISLSVVSEEEIHELNRNFRETDRVTDVLSFPQYASLDEIGSQEVILLGDVVICDTVARRQAEQYGHSYEREFVYLFVHSVLHLLGYDHMEPEEKKEMRAKEEEVMSYIGLQRGFTPAEDFNAEEESAASSDPMTGRELPQEETESPEETDYRELMDFARSAVENSYAPYSGFHVGAALLTADGSVYTGVNVENASYGASICAERSAVAAAVSDGCREFEAIAVYSPDGDASPCGICRQVLMEFGDNIRVVTCEESGELDVCELSSLLPKGFVL